MPRDRQDAELLANIKDHLPRLEETLRSCRSDWVGEDLVYRFWHQSLKVYGLQEHTERIVDDLVALAPEGCALHVWFREIVSRGTGRRFELTHNDDWTGNALPIVDAFFHARFMLEMAVRYGQELETTPNLLPSGWAALLSLYGIR